MFERIDFNKQPISIAIPMQFDGPQPNHFGANKATAKPMQSGDFIGDTTLGGSCNAQEITLNPHCNGTHTESISHVINELVSPAEVIKQPLMMAYVLTVASKELTVKTGRENSYQPQPSKGDLLLCKKSFTDVKKNIQSGIKALIIRTLPNTKAKLSQVYSGAQQPPFFSNEAMQWLVKYTEVEHLLVDMPSVDRLEDNGLLSNHRIFWNIKKGVHQFVDDQLKHKTITEMVFVPDDVKDGQYVLNLQIPRLMLNAVPSNPVLYHLKPQV